MTKGFKVVIPARYGSTRLPGKPLLPIAGRPLIQHVIARALASGAETLVVASDDQRVLDACRGLDVEPVLTSGRYQSGTDRIAAVVEELGWSAETIVVNLQGDEPCMPPALLDQVATELAERPAVGMATLACPIAESATLFDPHCVKVVRDAAGLALYFSRAPIPWHRDEFLGERAVLPSSVSFLRHIGLYAYRVDFLRRYVQMAPAPLELAESLEQLRVLWHGERLYVGLAAEAPPPGVDTPDDLVRVRHLLAVQQHAGNASD